MRMCRARVGEGLSDEFEVKVGIHQGSVLSPLLFIVMLEALSREFRAGVPWDDLHADDLVIIADTLKEYVRRLLTWKEGMVRKGLRVNKGKTKIIICGTGLDLLQCSDKFPCAICRCRQQQYSMQRMQALGAQEVHWAQTPEEGPKLQVLQMSRNCPTHRQKTTEGGRHGGLVVEHRIPEREVGGSILTQVAMLYP